MATKREMVVPKALEIIKNTPAGIRYSELVRKIKDYFPDTPINTIHGIVWDLDAQKPKEVYKAARGLFRHVIYRETSTTEHEQRVPISIEIRKEEDFYEPFAEWLVNELEECTKAIPLGGKKFKDKWGTPDVLGVLKPRTSDIVKTPIEIVSAEVKTDTRDLITAFGQACSYKLFSHKSYIVIPKNSSDEDKERVEALCLIFGLGLVLFDITNSKDPQFEIRTRAIKHEPDMFYVNTYMKIVEDELFS